MGIFQAVLSKIAACAEKHSRLKKFGKLGILMKLTLFALSKNVTRNVST